MQFYSTCQLLDDATIFTKMNTAEIRDTTTIEILHTVKNIRNITCNLVRKCDNIFPTHTCLYYYLKHVISYFQQLNQISGWNLLNEDGSCSDSALDLLCTKFKLVHDTDSAQRLLNVPYNECTWLDEILGEDPEVPQQIKDTIREKLACPPKA